jgi:hypothetical protein
MTPTNGTAYSTLFTFSADNFQDPDLPITYQFGYSMRFTTTSPNIYVVLRSRSARTFFFDAVLPPGLFVLGFELACIAQIFDSIDAVATRVYPTVVVEKVMSWDEKDTMVTGYLDTLSSQLSGSNQSVVDVDTIKTSLAYASSLINQVDCRAAPNCTALHRDYCSFEANTCGACISPYIGDSGASNNTCIDASGRTNKLANETCQSDVDCSGFDVCNNDTFNSTYTPYTPYTCYTPSKSCSGSSNGTACSGNGTCTFFTVSRGIFIDDCKVGDSSCKALCVCNEDSYGKACELDGVQFNKTLTQRKELLDGLDLQINNEDQDETTVNGWCNGLEQMAGNDPSILSSELAESVAESVFFLTTSSFEVGMTSAEPLLKSLDTAITATTEVELTRRRRRQLQGTTDSTNNVTITNSSILYRDCLLNYGYMLTSNSLVPGQEPMEVISSSFRLFSQRTEGGAGAQVAAPLSGLEIANEAKVSSFNLEGSNASLQVNLVTMSSSTYGAGDFFNSDPATLSMSGTPCAGNGESEETSYYVVDGDETASDADCKIEVVLQNSFPVTYPEPVIEYFNVTCTRKDRSAYNHTCMDGYEIVVRCNGTVGTYYTSCPYTQEVSSCNSISGNSVGEYQCEQIGLTATSTTCLCDFPIAADNSGSRRMLKSKDNKEGEEGASDGEGESVFMNTTVYSATLVAMGETVAREFVSNLVSTKVSNYLSIATC